jgi:hypothetical protein
VLIHGRCHCGNIAFDLTWEPDCVDIPARACTCTFCTKHGAVWTADPGAALQIAIEDPARTFAYAFGTRTADFHVCTRCGMVPVVTSRIDGTLYAVVNVNAFEGFDRSRLRSASTNLDGEGQEDRLARRKRNWIARVTII